MNASEATLQYLLDLHGEEIHYQHGYLARFKVVRAETSRERPHGISCSLALHGPDGRRLIGYDNAHGVAHRGGHFMRKPESYDHWHRDETDRGRPYEFVSAEQLIADFLMRWNVS